MVAKAEFEVIADIKKALASLRSLETDGKKAVSGLSSSFNALKLAAGGIAGAIGGIAIGKIVGDLGDFSKAVAEVKTIAPDVIKNNKDLAKSFIELGSEFGTDAGKQAKLLYQIISAGITDAAKSQEALIASNKLAIGGLAGTEESVNILTTALNVYKDENLSAANAADILFTTVKLGKTTVSDLASTLGDVLPIAKTFGLSFEEVNGAIADLTAKGIPTTAKAVTALKGVLNGVIQAQGMLSGESKKVQDAFSISALKTKDFTTFLKDANAAIGGNEVKLKKLLGSIEGVTGFLTLSSDGFKGLTESIDQMTKSTGAADEAYKGIANTLGFQLDKLKANFGNLILRFATEGESDLTNIIKSINESIVFMIKNFDDVTKQVQRVILDVGIMAFAFKGIPLIIKQIQISMTSLNASINSSVFYVKVFGKIFAATRYQAIALNLTIKALKISLSFGVLLVVDFIIEKVLELKEEFGGFINLAQAGASQIKIYFLEAINAILPAINYVAEAFGRGFDVKAVIEDNNKAIKESTKSIDNLKKTASDSKEFTKGMRDLQEELDKAKESAKDTKDQLEDTFNPKVAEDFLKTVRDQNEKLSQDIKKVGKDQIDIIKIDTEYQVGKINAQIASLDLTKDINKETKKGLEEQIKLLTKLANLNIKKLTKKEDKKPSIIKDFLNETFSELLTPFNDFISENVDQFKDGINSVFKFDVFSYLKESFSTASDITSEVFSSIADASSAIYDAFSSVYNTLSNAADVFVNTISTGFNAIFGAGLITNINNVFSQIANAPDNFIKAFDEFDTIVDGLGGKLASGLKKVLARLPEFFKKAIQVFKEVIPILIDALPDLIRGLMDGIIDLADELFSNAIPKLVDALPGIVDSILERLPDLLKVILKALPKIIRKIADSLPVIVKSLSDALPGLIEVLADNIGPIVSALTEGLIAATPNIIVSLVDSFITRGGALRISIALAKGFVSAIGGLLSGISKGVQALFTQAFTQGAVVFGDKLKIKQPEWVDKLRSSLNGGKFVEILQKIVDFLQKIADQISKALGQGSGGVVGALKKGDVGGVITQVLGGPGKALGFAEGGIVPSGFPNDTFPASLTSGELVIDRSTVDRLNKFMDQGGAQNNQPIQIVLKVGESELSRVMYKLNKQGYRVA